MTKRIRTNNLSGRSVTGQLALRGLAAGGLTIAANLLIYWLAPALFNLTLAVPVMGPGSPVGPLPFTMVIFASILPTIGATLLLAALYRYTAHPVTIFRLIASLFLLLSFAAPLSLPVPLAVRLTLAGMHVITAAIIVYLLTGKAREG